MKPFGVLDVRGGAGTCGKVRWLIDTGFFAVAVTDSLVITDVFPNGPAAEVGLQPRDPITAVDGRPVAERLALEATDDAPDPIGATVELPIRSLDQSSRIVHIEWRPDAGEIVPSSRRLEADATIGYLRIPMFTRNMGNQVTRTLETLLQGLPLRGLVIDLRANGGGEHDALTSILGQFVTGTVAQMQGRWGSRSWIAGQSPLYEHLQSVPAVVLVDQHTNSAAEMMAAVLQDQDRATVVGVPTHGNVEGLVLHTFADRSVLWLAVDIFKLPNDSKLDEQG